jgi:thioredoxin 1
MTVKMNNQVILTDANFRQLALQNDIPVLVVFGTDWSGPNHILEPILEKFAVAFESRVLVGKVDASKNKMVISLYPTERYPTLILFIDGEVSWKFTGLISLRSLWDTVEALIEGGNKSLNRES